MPLPGRSRLGVGLAAVLAWAAALWLLWGPPANRPRAVLPAAGESPPVFSPDSRWLAAASAQGLKVWGVPAGEERLTLPGGLPVAFSPDGNLLISEDAVQTYRLWDL